MWDLDNGFDMISSTHLQSLKKYTETYNLHYLHWKENIKLMLFVIRIKANLIKKKHNNNQSKNTIFEKYNSIPLTGGE